MSDKPTGDGETFQLPEQYIYGGEPPPPSPATADTPLPANPSPRPPSKVATSPPNLPDDEIEPPIERHDPSTTCAAPGG